MIHHKLLRSVCHPEIWVIHTTVGYNNRVVKYLATSNVEQFKNKCPDVFRTHQEHWWYIVVSFSDPHLANNEWRVAFPHPHPSNCHTDLLIYTFWPLIWIGLSLLISKSCKAYSKTFPRLKYLHQHSLILPKMYYYSMATWCQCPLESFIPDHPCLLYICQATEWEGTAHRPAPQTTHTITNWVCREKVDLQIVDNLWQRKRHILICQGKRWVIT